MSIVSTPAADSGSTVAAQTAKTGNPTLVAILLMVAYLFSFLDRQILVLMIEPIQRDLELNDTMFSLLHGASFALFYTIVGMFMGRLVDSYSRVRIISISIFLWSIATAVCGISRSFAQLFIARIFVGVGEAGLAPGAYSLLADLFKPRQRARAFAIYAMGIYLGTGLAFILGGKLVDVLDAMPPTTLPVIGTIFSWQLAFFIVGLPGLFLAVLIYAVIKEPTRGANELTAPPEPETDRKPAGFADFFRHYRQEWKPYLAHNVGFGLHMMFGYALLAWLPALFLRVHGWTITEVGFSVGLLLLICGPAGSLLGGYVSQYMLEKGITDSQLRLGAFGSLALGVFGVLAAGSQNDMAALAATGVCIVFIGLPGGLNAASLQTITPSHLRGQAAAFFMLIGNILGLGLGPLCVALLTDFVFGDKNLIHQSLQVFALVSMPLSAALLWNAKHYFKITEHGDLN